MSVITYGTGYVGKVDRVPGKYYIATKAFQVINVPLFPLGSYLVEEGSETQTFMLGLVQFSGVEIGLSWKSFAWGVARALLLGGALLTFLGVLPMLFGVEGVAALLLGPVLGIVMMITWWKTRRGLPASPARARELEQLAKNHRLPHAVARTK